MLKILNHDGLWENRKSLNENQRFDWIKSIHWCRLVNIGWLADIDLSDSMLDDLTCLTVILDNENTERTWLIRAHALQIL